MSTLNRGTIFDLDRLFRHQNPSHRYSNARNQKPKAIIEQPKVDISDTGDAYELVAELPGVDKSNIFVTIEESELVIETKAVEPTEKDENIVSIRQERYAGGYKRSFNLGENVDRESIKAQFKDGLLILTIAKKEDTVQKPKTIEIH
ncbi:MAG: HSP20 family protein [Oceanicoccus sp.]|jgi:HSP20 family protein